MMHIDWAYLRNSWNSCKKTREVLGANALEIQSQTDARKERIEADAAWDLVTQANRLKI